MEVKGSKIIRNRKKKVTSTQSEIKTSESQYKNTSFPSNSEDELLKGSEEGEESDNLQKELLLGEPSCSFIIFLQLLPLYKS